MAAGDTTAVGTTTYTGPDPGLGQYGILSNAAHLAMTDAQTQIQNNRTSLFRGAGVTQTDGGGWSIDPNGQGTYQQVMQGNAQQGAADSAAFGAMGFGGGLLAQQKEAAQSSYSQHAADWLNQMTTGTTSLNNQDTANVNLENTTNFNNLMSDITSAIQNHQFNPANYDGIVIPGYDIKGDLSKIDPSQVPNDPGSGFIGGTGGSNPPPAANPYHIAGKPHFNDYNADHPNKQMTYKQWVKAGRPH